MTIANDIDGNTTETNLGGRLKAGFRRNVYKLLLRFGIVFSKSDGMGTQIVDEGRKSWTRMDKLLLAFGILVNLGDGVEIYLPGWFL